MAPKEETRLRILTAALDLLVAGGREAVSTRAVTDAVGIQAPTLYRIFGDKQGLLDAVALHGFETHLASWQGWQPGTDPVEAMRQGWDMHVAWGTQNPGLYAIAYGDARPGTSSPAAEAISAILRTLVEQVAAGGRLAVPVAEAVTMLRAVGSGVVFTLVALPGEDGVGRLSERAREAALAAILVDDPEPSVAGRTGAAMQLRSDLDTSTSLSPNERALLGDWLDRLAAEQ